MQLLIYASAAAPAAHHLLNDITQAAHNVSIDTFDSLDSLIQHLRKPIHATLLAVLLPKDNDELSLLIQMRHLLRDIRIVLILPNRDGKTISSSHILRPRYVSHGDGDLSDVVAVVRKIAGMQKSDYMRAV